MSHACWKSERELVTKFNCDSLLYSCQGLGNALLFMPVNTGIDGGVLRDEQ